MPFQSGLNQALAVRMNRVESRMYEALEPVYIAFQHNRDGVESLEALMVDVAEKLEGLKEPQVMVFLFCCTKCCFICNDASSCHATFKYLTQITSLCILNRILLVHCRHQEWFPTRSCPWKLCCEVVQLVLGLHMLPREAGTLRMV